VIEVQSLSRFYGSHQAVKDVTFSIAANEVVGFLGLNGAGKSTTLKVIAGLLPPSSGTVIVDGVDVSTAPTSFRARIGYLPEEPPLYKEMTVTEYLRFLGGLRGMSSAQIKARMPGVIKLCQLSGQENRVIGELSHGYRKRVGIAQAIIHSPRLVILDEPISGLDPYQIVEMREVIKGLAAEATVLVSSHILSEISQTCDRLLVLGAGRLVAQGTEEELSGGGGTGVDLELTLRGDAQRIHSLLSGLASVETFELTSGEGGTVQATVRLLSDEREALVVALVGAGVGVRQIGESHSELERIFLNLTRVTAA
jgi:ABC-2 type transport system ATP-binding protein